MVFVPLSPVYVTSAVYVPSVLGTVIVTCATPSFTFPVYVFPSRFIVIVPLCTSDPFVSTTTTGTLTTAFMKSVTFPTIILSTGLELTFNVMFVSATMFSYLYVGVTLYSPGDGSFTVTFAIPLFTSAL